MKLTDISLRALKAPEKGAVTYFDDTLKGFGVRVSSGGTKSYVLLIGNSRRSWSSSSAIRLRPHRSGQAAFPHPALPGSNPHQAARGVQG